MNQDTDLFKTNLPEVFKLKQYFSDCLPSIKKKFCEEGNYVDEIVGLTQILLDRKRETLINLNSAYELKNNEPAPVEYHSIEASALAWEEMLVFLKIIYINGKNNSQ